MERRNGIGRSELWFLYPARLMSASTVRHGQHLQFFVTRIHTGEYSTGRVARRKSAEQEVYRTDCSWRPHRLGKQA
jgi:hypothetical protein